MKMTFQERVANAERVREEYRTNPRARELSSERGRRFRERQAAKAHEDALDRWVHAVMHAEGAEQ